MRHVPRAMEAIMTRPGVVARLLALLAAALPAAVEARADQGARPVEEEQASARERMVDRQIVARGIRDPRVLDAMRLVPRHRLVPAEVARLAYDDRPLSIGHGQTISQPYIVALMTELARVAPGDRVLEIGTGSGYQAAVLAQLAGHVYSIEIVEPLARRAATDLEALGYDNVSVRAGDGYAGWPEHAPFDVIIVTAAPDEVPAPLLEQLKPGGRMVVPVGRAWAMQRLKLIEKREDGSVGTRNVAPVRFVPFTREPKARGER